MSFSLSNQEKQFLLQLARDTIITFLTSGNKKREKYFSDNLKTPTGVFVTLHEAGDLRGCIGYVEGVKPLQDAVIDNAVSAAFSDPRFMPVGTDEVEQLDIEISVLTPLELVQNTEEIEVGKDGLLMKRGYNQGLLLPQVASEQQWDRETFLQHTCMKAGLPIDAWQDDETEIYKFSAIIFGEKE
ncbi:MAG: AmmeMemoRadiSam system protein A [Calditrichaceae bacterium]|nr:AmmeMemoRadiSam system protein A [Calditrichaceae bacterium]